MGTIKPNKILSSASDFVAFQTLLSDFLANSSDRFARSNPFPLEKSKKKNEERKIRIFFGKIFMRILFRRNFWRKSFWNSAPFRG